MLIHAPVFSGESLTLIHTPVVDWGVHNKKKLVLIAHSLSTLDQEHVVGTMRIGSR